MNTLIRTVLLGAVAITLALGLTPSPVSAHTPEAVATCEGLSVTLTQYEGPAQGMSTNNYVTIFMDGAQMVDAPFAHDYAETFQWSTEASEHTYEVRVDANTGKGDPDRWDVILTGSVTDCPVTPPPTTEPPLPPVTVPEPEPEPEPTPTTTEPPCVGICGPATVTPPEPEPQPECTSDGRYREDLGRCEYPGAPYCPEGLYPQAYELDAPCEPEDPCTDAGSTLWGLLPCEPDTDTPTDTTPPVVTPEEPSGDLPATGSNTTRTIAGIAFLLLVLGIVSVAMAVVTYEDEGY